MQCGRRCVCTVRASCHHASHTNVISCQYLGLPRNTGGNALDPNTPDGQHRLGAFSLQGGIRAATMAHCQSRFAIVERALVHDMPELPP
eukprot:9268538-Karenia_brevis.AAC.1